ncbi:PAC2 family protein [uncultured Rothia sp.]|uniref:PAC2 family protein n=1 Tax=uncultured Rothia sp. TaxID=316088 RepID=UPI0028ED8316|nr:PAC2 family protein [uncultured Rothia sp.]
MLNPEDLYLANTKILDDPRMHGLTLIIALSSPQDAGSTAGQLGQVLLSELKNIEIVEFDSDQLHNYRARRPFIRYEKDHFEKPQYPQLKLYAVEDSLDKPFLLLTGAEPDLQWQRFEKAVLTIVQRVKPSLVVLVSAFPMPVPHTRPFPITAHGSRKDLIRGISPWKPTADVHATITNLLEVLFTENGIDTVGFGVNIPQYISEADLPQGTLTALEHVGMAAHLSLPTENLREAARHVHSQINDQVKQNPEIGRMITTMEENYDENFRTSDIAVPLSRRDAHNVPSRDEIGALFERFLDEQ